VVFPEETVIAGSWSPKKRKIYLSMERKVPVSFPVVAAKLILFPAGAGGFERWRVSPLRRLFFLRS